MVYPDCHVSKRSAFAWAGRIYRHRTSADKQNPAWNGNHSPLPQNRTGLQKNA